MTNLEIAQKKMRERLQTQTQRVVASFRANPNLSLHQIGNAFGISRQRVHQILQPYKAVAVGKAFAASAGEK